MVSALSHVYVWSTEKSDTDELALDTYVKDRDISSIESKERMSLSMISIVTSEIMLVALLLGN